jgi:hypothetical protein
MGGWTLSVQCLRNIEDLNDLYIEYYSGDQINNEMGGVCSTYGKPRCRLKDNIKMNLQEVGLGGLGLV